jgi:glycosyltransferase involved in cell wall biosynthesis
MNYSLAVLLTTHAEGVELEKTLINLFQCVEYAKKRNIFSNISILCTLDNGKEQTRKILNRYKDTIKVFEVSFGDLGLCRNFLINQSQADFLHTWDADDFVDINALAVIGKCLMSHYKEKPLNSYATHEHIAVFPKYLVEFPKFHLQEYVESNDFIKANMLFEHVYISKICLAGVVAKQFLYKQNTEFFAFEDWDYNLQLLYAGVQFKLADYKFYYRKKSANKSLNLQQHNKIQHYSNVFDAEATIPVIDSIVNYEEYVSIEHRKRVLFKKTIKRGIKKSLLFVPFGDSLRNRLHQLFLFYKNMKANRKLRKDIVETDVQKTFRKSQSFLHDYSEILLENNFSSGNFESRAIRYLPITSAFYKFKEIFEGIEAVIFAPWITRGGADKLVIEHAKTLHDAGYKVLVVPTLSRGEWFDQLPCKTLYLGDLFQYRLDIAEELKACLYALLACKPRLIHVINSEFAWELYKKYGKLLQSFDIRFYASAYCPVLIKGQYFGYPVHYKDCLTSLDGVITDSDYWIPYFSSLAGGTKHNIFKIPAPVSDNFILHTPKPWSDKIFWASRISDQKLPHVLLKIARALPEKTFYVYGPTNEVSDAFLSEMYAVRNIKMLGSFEDIKQIPINEYDCFLYTSSFDGIPNIILEMVSFLYIFLHFAIINFLL